MADSRNVKTAKSPPIGARTVFTRKTERQSKASTSTPPMGGPVTAPSATTVDMSPSARPRSWGGKAATEIAMLRPCTAAAPTAWMARAPNSQGRLGAAAASAAPPPSSRKPMT